MFLIQIHLRWRYNKLIKVLMLLFGTAMITWQRGTENLIINQHVLRSRTLMKNWSGWKKYQILKRLCNEKVVHGKNWIIYHTVLRILAALVRCTSFLRSSREYSPFQEAQQFLIVGFLRKKMSYFLDHHLHHGTKGGKSYVKGTKYFVKKIKQLGKLTPNSIWVTVNVVGLYPGTPHDASLKALQEKLEERKIKKLLLWVWFMYQGTSHWYSHRN